MNAHIARMRIQIEYIEMPDLKLTRAQLTRLCDLTPPACEEALARLLQTGFLAELPNGALVRRGLTRAADAIVGPPSLAGAA